MAERLEGITEGLRALALAGLLALGACADKPIGPPEHSDQSSVKLAVNAPSSTHQVQPWALSNAPDRTPPPHSCGVVKNTADGFLALRGGPGVSYSILEKLTPGQNLNVFPCDDLLCKATSWRKVEEPADDAVHRGWVNIHYLNTVAC